MLSVVALPAGGAHSVLNPGLFFSLLFLGYLLYRQRQVRPVPRTPRLRVSLIAFGLGLVNTVTFLSGGPQVTAVCWVILATSFLVGAALGVARAYTVRLWFVERRLMRQGTWWTIVLWLVAVVLHTLAGLLIEVVGENHGLGSATGLLYLAMSFAVQQVVVVRRGRERRERARQRRAALSTE